MDKYYEYIENTFGYLKDKTINELEEEKAELEEELYDIETREIPEQAKTERETDKHNAEKKLLYIDNLLGVNTKRR